MIASDALTIESRFCLDFTYQIVEKVKQTLFGFLLNTIVKVSLGISVLNNTDLYVIERGMRFCH